MRITFTKPITQREGELQLAVHDQPGFDEIPYFSLEDVQLTFSLDPRFTHSDPQSAEPGEGGFVCIPLKTPAGSNKGPEKN